MTVCLMTIKNFLRLIFFYLMFSSDVSEKLHWMMYFMFWWTFLKGWTCFTFVETRHWNSSFRIVTNIKRNHWNIVFWRIDKGTDIEQIIISDHWWFSYILYEYTSLDPVSTCMYILIIVASLSFRPYLLQKHLLLD